MCVSCVSGVSWRLHCGGGQGRQKGQERLTATSAGPPVAEGLVFVDQVLLFHLKNEF